MTDSTKQSRPITVGELSRRTGAPRPSPNSASQAAHSISAQPRPVC